MTEALSDFSKRARTERSWWVAAGLIGLGLIYPLIVDSLKELPP
jgi:hypothetical protein